jgi:NtrC-family two-component system response regulator AlgB
MKKTILVVDDDANIRKTLALSLKDLGCVVEQASSVDEAREMLGKAEFDLILTDYKMEVQNGLDLIRHAKIKSSESIIVVMTAFASFENAVEVVKAGAFDYLSKPFTRAQLVHLMSKVRGIVQLKHENRALKNGKNRRSFS